MTLNRILKNAVLAALTVAGAGTAWSQTALPPSFALPKSAADATAPGFIVRVAKATATAGQLPNNNTRTELQLAGTLINPVTKLPYENIVDPSGLNADGTYFETSIISYNKTGSPTQFPGLPSVVPDEENNFDNIAMDAVAYLSLDPGTYSMIVKSDDGFKVTAGLDARDQLNSIKLGEYEGGRGASDTAFSFSVSQAGLYSFRLTYEQGGGDASVDWYTAPVGDPDARVYINDAGGVSAFRKVKATTLPYVSLGQPLPGAKDVSPSAPIKYIITDGSPNTVVPSTVVLSFDGVNTGSTATKAGSATTISYTPPTLLEPLSVHTVKLVFGDSASNFRTNEFTFTASSVGNITLPPWIYLETFDEVPEGQIPAGWTAVNYTDSRTPGEDLDDPNSDSFLGWISLSSNRVASIGVAGRWDGPRRLAVREQYVNGVRVDSLITNNFMYAESDTRGGSQVQYLFSKDYDFSSYSNVFVSFHNIYEQNQDSMGSVEYSIDGGKNWQPVVYYLDGPDIVHLPSGEVDGYNTLIAPQGDTATYTDPVTSDSAGGYYGAFIGIQDTNRWAALGPYISERVNDDYVEGKRVEIYRLPLADKQKTVRLRFAQAGTGSWYFGIDDLGFYSITKVDAPKFTIRPSNVSRIAGFNATFTGAASGVEVKYQWLHAGTNLPGATGSTLTLAKVGPLDAGTYTLQASNSGGTISADATLTLLPSPEPVLTVTNGLVTHLKFDGDYSDASGNGVNGTPNGTPYFTNGPVGGAVYIKNLKDGSRNDYVSLGYPNVLKFGDEKVGTTGSDFSVSFWVHLIEQNDDQAFISQKDWNSSNNRGWGIFSQGGSVIRNQITGPNGGSDKFSKNPAPGLNDGKWHLLTVVVKRGSTVDTYSDGSLLQSDVIATKGSIDTDDLGFAVNIGQDGTGKYTDGGSAEIEMVMDDLGIWRRALTADEVAAIYLRGTNGKSLDVVPGAGSAPVVSAPTLAGGNVTLSWAGGVGPFKVQVKTALNAATWTDLTTTTSHTYTTPAGGAASFYRVVDTGL